MEDFDYLILARVIHVIGVVLWIGGVAFVTTVLIPSLREMVDAEKRLELFETLEGRFSLQAKFVTAATGISGFVMVEGLDVWSRYADASFWWMHLMTFIWVVFSVVLFILEPAFLHRWFHEQAEKNPERTFLWIHRLHIVLLTWSLVAILGAVVGVRLS